MGPLDIIEKKEKTPKSTLKINYDTRPEDLKNKPQSEWTPEDWERVDPGDGGKYIPAPWDYPIAAIGAWPLMSGAVKKWGLDKTAEVGVNALFPDAPDVLLEQLMRDKGAGLFASAHKGIRLSKAKAQEILTNVFDNRAIRNIDDDGLVDEVLTHKDDVVFQPGSVEENIAQTTQAMAKGDRAGKSKFTKGMVYDSTIELGGTPADAKRIWEYQQKEHTGIKKAVSLLNEIYQIYEPNTRISIRNGKLSFIPRTRIGSNLADRSPLYKKSWQFDKDHIRAVINQFGPMEGADMAENLEIIFGSLNRKKSNVFELPAEILDELGVPKNIDEFVFKQLNPEFAEFQNKIPNRWKESFTKNILNDYYERLYGSAIYKPGMEPIVSKKKWPAIMRRLVKKYKHVFSDKQLLQNLELMEATPFWKRIKPNEIPKWAQTLDMPPNLKDPFWLSMGPKHQKRWIRLVKDKQKLVATPLPHTRGLRVEGSKEKYRILEDLFPDE